MFNEGNTPNGLTLAQEVRALLSGRGREIGFSEPQRDPSWIPPFLARLHIECGRLPLCSDPVEMARTAGFALVHINLTARCGASTHRGLILPTHGSPADDALTGAHELQHAIGKRLGIHASEADWWMATAGFVWIAIAREEGAARYPAWFCDAIPCAVRACF